MKLTFSRRKLAKSSEKFLIHKINAFVFVFIFTRARSQPTRTRICGSNKANAERAPARKNKI